MFEGLKKGYAEGKKEAMVKKYIADERAKIAARKKQESAKPSALGKAIGAVAYKVGKSQKKAVAKAEKLSEPTGKTAAKLAAGAKWIWDNIPDQKKASTRQAPASPKKKATPSKSKQAAATYMVMLNPGATAPKKKPKKAATPTPRDNYLNIR